VRLTIDFADAYRGVTKKIQYTRKIFDDHAKKETCTTCAGRGVVNQQAQTPFGVMQVQNACPDCGGMGEIYTRDGKRVGNGGLIDAKETIGVEVPAGIKDDVFLKYGSMGHMGPGGQHPGDLYIKIAIKDMGSYTREGDDLYLKQEISLFDAVLGGKITIDHPEGKLTISIPKRTQPHEKIKVSGKGFGRKGLLAHRGDLYIIPRIAIPKKLSKEQEKIWKELQASQ
jgi:molecular chaperone DnaJ